MKSESDRDGLGEKSRGADCAVRAAVIISLVSLRAAQAR
jgi:hypothetical protein